MTNIVYAFNLEKFADLLDQSLPMFEEHYAEIAMYQDKIKLSVDTDFYKTAEESGVLKFFTLRANGELAGYAAYLVRTNPHYSNTVYAVNDVVWISPALRNKGVGKDLLTFAEEYLKQEGVSVITMHMKTFAPFEELMQSLSYDKAEYIYTKYIGE